MRKTNNQQPTTDHVLGQRGIASLAITLLLGALIVEAALAGIAIATIVQNQGFGIRLSAQAFAAAQSGIAEGLLRIVRTGTAITSPAGPIAVAGFSFGGPSIESLRICKDFTGSISGACGGTSAPGTYEVISVGRALTKKRQLIAVAEVEPVTGVVQVRSVREQAL